MQSEFNFGDEHRRQQWSKIDGHNAAHPDDLHRLVQAARDAVVTFGGWTIHMARDIAAIRHGRSVSRSLLPGYARDIMAMCSDLRCNIKHSRFGETRPQA
jgi:hypothetical protein